MPNTRIEKYIEERFPFYFEFGGGCGTVEVASIHNDTIASCTPEQAKYLIADRQKLLDAFVLLAEAVDRNDGSAKDTLNKIMGYK